MHASQCGYGLPTACIAELSQQDLIGCVTSRQLALQHDLHDVVVHEQSD